MNVDDGLEDIRWIRGLGGEKLPAASDALFPNIKKSVFFAIGEGREISSPVFYAAAAKVFVSDAWPAPATYHRSFCEHWPEGGSEPLTSAPRSDFMAQSLVLSIDVCRRLGNSPLRTNI